jgi:hypothetical protein
MIIHNLDIERPIGRPSEADAPLPIDPNAELPAPVALERLQLVSRRAQIVKPNSRVNHIQFACRHGLEGSPSSWTDAFPKEPFGSSIGKALNHDCNM